MPISPPVFPPKNFVPFTFIHDIQYGEANGIPLLLDMLCPYPVPGYTLPVVIYIHGGGWDGGQRSGGLAPWLSPLLATQGFLAVTISYRLSYQANFPAQLHDVKAAVRWLRANAERYHIHPERIGVWGFSAGGHLSSLLGVTGNQTKLEGDSGSPGYSSNVQAVVAVAAPSDFFYPGGLIENSSEVKHLLGGTVLEREELARLASPLYHVTSDAPPYLLIHGTHDEVVPFEHTKRMYEALKVAGVEANILSTTEGHSWGAEWYELTRQCLAFFQKFLSY